MNINRVIFTRTAPAKKLEIVKNLTEAELLVTTPDTIVRVVKEVGSRRYKSRDKELYIPYDLRTGNHWNSEFEGISLYKGQPSALFYLQYENTDTSASAPLSSFLKKGDYEGSVRRDDSHGNSRHYYFTYSEGDKAECIRAILQTYINVKYKDKLR